jgi:hypothetical protein
VPSSLPSVVGGDHVQLDDLRVEEVKHSIQKELRIIDTHEPVMAQHKLIIDPKVIEDDHRTVQTRASAPTRR